MPVGIDKDRNWAVALVHGIGTTESRYLIRDIATAIQASRPELKLDDHTVVIENPDGTTQYERRGQIGWHKVRFATAHWSDISVIRDGFLGLLGGLLLTGMGVRYFSNVAVDRKNFLARTFQVLLNTIVRVIALLIVPITGVSLIMCVMALSANYIFPVAPVDVSIPVQSYEYVIAERNNQWVADFSRAVLTAALTLFICWFFAVRGCLRNREARNERPLAVPLYGMFGVIGFLVTFSLFATHVYVDQAGYAAGQNLIDNLRFWVMEIGRYFGNDMWIARVTKLNLAGLHFAVVQIGQFACGLLMLSLSLLATFLLAVVYMFRLFDRDSRRGLLLAVSSVISIWVLFLLLFWPENFLMSGAMTTYSTGPLAEPVTSLSFNVWNWTFLTLAISDFKEYVPLLWYEVVFFGLLLMIFFIIIGLLILRSTWKRIRDTIGPDKYSVRDRKAWMKSSWPRIIVPPFYMFSVIVFTFVVSVFPVAQLTGYDNMLLEHIGLSNKDKAELARDSGLSLDDYRAADWGVRSERVEARADGQISVEDKPSFPDEFMARSDIVKLFVLVAVIGFLALAHYIRNGAKLLLDVVNHFTGQNPNYPLRERIAARFHGCIDHLLKDNDKPNLVILAHSQGTVITLDALLAKIWEDKLKDKVSSLTVVTFGSPISHVYQHYFSHVYPPLNLTNLKELAKDPRINWFNCYRVDDYVGTFIEQSVPDFPVNIPLKGGGHTRYWEPEVFERLFKEAGMESFLTSPVNRDMTGALGGV